jgi:fatty-acyl-CoA synthase
MPVLTTLSDVLRLQADARPHAVALRFSGVDSSYAQLAAQAYALAQYLRASGVQRGDRVAYLGLNHPLQIALLFAVAQVRAIFVPLNFRLAAPEWDGVTADCTPTQIFSDDHWAAQASDLAARAGIAHALIDVAANTVHRAPMAPHAPQTVQAAQANSGDSASSAAQSSDPVLLVYTSGTTGQPKGALHTQGNLLANMALASTQMALTPADTVLTTLPLFHVGGLCIQTLPALYAGARVVLHARFDAGALLACLAQDRPTLTLLVPAVMRALLEHPSWPSTDLSSLRAVWAGSSILPPHLVQAFTARGIALCNVYGSTETGPFSIALGPAHAASHCGSCGWPASAPGLQVEVRLAAVTAHEDTPGSQGQCMGNATNGADDIGELCLRAPNVAQRYWPDVNALDSDGYFHTGDIARRALDGSYTVVGRAKDMLISGGENIYPAEIENLLLAHPLVAECAVLGLPDPQWGEVVVACVVAHASGADHAVLIAALAEFVADKIARYKEPRQWLVLDALPKTALGKVQKDRLLAQLPMLFSLSTLRSS